MKMTEELQQIVPARQGDFGTARLNGDDAETGGVAKTLRVDGLGKLRRICLLWFQWDEIYAGIRTGSSS